jgi:hypothetical protein
MTCIMGCRLVLNLREAHYRPFNHGSTPCLPSMDGLPVGSADGQEVEIGEMLRFDWQDRGVARSSTLACT